MQHQTISVIIPVYNAENYVGRCIESVIAQTYNDWRMILVDDGSKDKSLEICRKFADADNRISVIHQENAGPGMARNAGIAKASGNYVVFIDSDDYIEKDYFQLLSKHDEDVVFIDVEAVDEGGDVVRREYLSQYKNMGKDDFLRAQMTGKINWGGVRKVVKRKIIDENNIRYSDHKVGEEALFTYSSVFNSKTIGFIEKPVYFYIQHADSLSHAKIDDPWGEVALALKSKTKENGSYIKYANTINAFLLTAAAVSSDRLAMNYSGEVYNNKMNILYASIVENIDNEFPIDYKHMSMKAIVLGKLLLKKHFKLIWLISKCKHLKK